MTTALGPVLKYPGSKWRLADWIVSHMPPHKVYVEPYFGSGAVFFTKPPAALETINDINEHVVNLFRVLRERSEELAAAIEMTPWSRIEYEMSYDRDLDSLDPVEAARRFLVRTWQGHGSAADQHRNGWRLVKDEDKGPRRTPYRQWQKLPERVLATADRLKNAQIECRPAVEVIEAFSQPGVLVYADPPYMLSTLSQTRNGRKIYDHQMTDEEHEQMLAVLLEHPGPAPLSGYDSPLYRRLEELADWMAVSVATYAEKGQQRLEVLWINPVAQEALGGSLFSWNKGTGSRS